MSISSNIKQLMVGSVLCVALLPVQAAVVADGFDAARQGDYGSALQFWQERARLGDAQAQFNLALMYHGGLGVESDETKALQWYQKAAQNGSSWAQEYLAIAYQEGWFGLKADHKKAKSWMKQLDRQHSF
jgi:hypothetical protein